MAWSTLSSYPDAIAVGVRLVVALVTVERAAPELVEPVAVARLHALLELLALLEIVRIHASRWRCC